MARVRRSLLALAGVAVLGSCSSSPSSTGSSPPSSPAPGQSSSTAVDEVQVYLGAVNALCDELLPKIIRVTHGGSVDVPVAEFLASWPEHDRLHKWFDARLARIPVPPGAEDRAAALAAYIRWANRINAARLTAARKGQKAYDKEMVAEADALNDPTIVARTAAGFAESCNAR